jgi:hypothetical protein
MKKYNTGEETLAAAYEDARRIAATHEAALAAEYAELAAARVSAIAAAPSETELAAAKAEARAAGRARYEAARRTREDAVAAAKPAIRAAQERYAASARTPQDKAAVDAAVDAYAAALAAAEKAVAELPEVEAYYAAANKAETLAEAADNAKKAERWLMWNDRESWVAAQLEIIVRRERAAAALASLPPALVEVIGEDAAAAAVESAIIDCNRRCDYGPPSFLDAMSNNAASALASGMVIGEDAAVKAAKELLAAAGVKKTEGIAALAVSADWRRVGEKTPTFFCPKKLAVLFILKKYNRIRYHGK